MKTIPVTEFKAKLSECVFRSILPAIPELSCHLNPHAE